jgi:hypothetical protein
MTSNGEPGGDAFERPGEGGSGGGSGEGFAAPTAAELGAEAAESEAAAIEATLSAELVALKAEIEKKLMGESGAEVAARSADSSNIIGVGYGIGDADQMSLGMAANLAPGETGLTVFTVEPVDMTQLVAEIASVAGTRALSTLPITQVATGLVDAQPHRFRMRPAPGGVSVAHQAVTAGTLGCLTVGLTAPRNSRLLVLSNNHVLANSNAARLGDCICQPGPADGGRCPADQIAILERFVPINFAGGINYVDGATGWAWPDRVRRELIYMRNGPQYFRVGASPLAPSMNLPVGKTGRTTQLTQGRIIAVNVSVNVNFGGGRVAHFRDQFAVRSPNGNFSAPGDSGSLIWHWGAGLAPVGLLFAGGGGTTFANRITRVLTALDVRMFN